MPSHSNNEVKVRRSKEHSDITTSDQGGTDRSYEEILDLSPPTDVEYLLKDHELVIVLELQDSGGNELTDGAMLRWVGQGPLQEDITVLTREYRYGEFANADQRNENEQIVFEFVLDPSDFPVTFTEASHLKLEMDHDTDVTWSNSSIEFEIYRKVYNS